MAETAKSIVEMMKDRISKAGKGDNPTFYVKKDGKVRIRFLSDMENATVVPFHSKWKGPNYPCLKLFGKPCPGCKDDDLKTADNFALTVWNYETKKREIFMYKATKCTPIPAMVTMYENYGTITDRDYTVARMGEGTDTTYSVIPLDRKRFKGDEEAFTKKEILKMLLKAYPPETDEDEEEEDEEEEIEEKSKRKSNSDVIGSSAKNKRKSNDDDEDFDDEEDDSMEDFEEVDYSSMSNAELKAEFKKRGWSCKGMNREQVIQALEDDLPF